MGYHHLAPQDDIEHLCIPQNDLHIREWMGVISQVDYLVGCDSVGQHITRSVGTKGCVIMGGTDEVNMSYPDYFRTIQKKETSVLHESFNDTIKFWGGNEDCMNYTEEEILDIYGKIKSDLEEILSEHE